MMRNRSLELLQVATEAIHGFETHFAPWARATARISYFKGFVEIRVFGHRSNVPVFTVSLGPKPNFMMRGVTSGGANG